MDARNGTRRVRGPRATRTAIVSGALVLLLGSTGLFAGHRASQSAQAVHRDDRMSLQTTLAGLVGQYTQVVAGSLRDSLARQIVDGRGNWRSQPTAETVERLSEVTRAAPTFDVGAVLISASGKPIAATGADLPAADDPGWDGLRAAVLSGQRVLPVSGVLDTQGGPAAAIALPVTFDDRSNGLVAGIFRIDRGPLQEYVSALRYGESGHGYVIDGAGRVVAGPAPEHVGNVLPIRDVRQRILDGDRQPGMLEGDGRVTSYAPAGSTGWTALTVQSHDEFLGPLQRSGRLAMGTLVLLLLISGTALVALNRKREAELQHVALRDDLTGVYNRRGWFAVAGHELERAKRNREQRALVFLDIDGLKVINDALGHREGDAAIVATARLLAQCARGSDVVGRLGGDEFVLLLGEDSDAAVVQRRILDAVAGWNATSSAPFELQLSAGLVTWSVDDPCSVDELVRRADDVMYVDKARRPHRTTLVVRPEPASQPVSQGTGASEQEPTPVG